MKKYFLSFCLIIIFFFMLFYPEEVRFGAAQGLNLWYTSVLPVLFPFLILSSILLSKNSLSLFLDPLFHFFKHRKLLNPWIIYPLFFGLFCGFPMGAKTICDLISDNKLTRQEANALLPIVSQASPMFITGYVGTLVLKQKLSFSCLFLCLYLPPLFFLIIWLFFHNRQGNTERNPIFSTISYCEINETNNYNAKETQKNSMFPQKEHTIWNSFTVMVTIGIYMMLFSVATRLGTILLPKNNIVSLLLCTLEFSSGIDTLNRISFLSENLRTGLILALTSFGGFCTAFQTSALTSKHHLSLKYYLFLKILLAVFVFFLYWIIQS